MKRVLSATLVFVMVLSMIGASVGALATSGRTNRQGYHMNKHGSYHYHGVNNYRLSYYGYRR